jgi:hypothetical protein
LNELKENELNEAKNLVTSVSEATSGPKFGVFEQILCSHLYQAGNTPDPLRKIQLISDAALMLEKAKRDSLGIDTEKTLVVKTICTAFLHALKRKIRDCSVLCVSVKFGFSPSEENYKRYIDPWYQNGALIHFPEYVDESVGSLKVTWRCARCDNEVGDCEKGLLKYTKARNQDSCAFCGANLTYDRYCNPRPVTMGKRLKRYKNTTDPEFFFGLLTGLSEASFIFLTNTYLEWATPFILDLTRRLSEAVRPEIYNEIAKMFADVNKEPKKEG